MMLLYTFLSSLRSSSGEDNSDDEAVEAKSFGENKDEDHSDVDVFLGVGADTSVTDDSNAKSSSEGWESTAKTSSQVSVAQEGSVGGGDGGDWATGRGSSFLD